MQSCAACSTGGRADDTNPHCTLAEPPLLHSPELPSCKHCIACSSREKCEKEAFKVKRNILQLIKELLELMFIVISHAERHFQLRMKIPFLEVTGTLQHSQEKQNTGPAVSHSHRLPLLYPHHLHLPWHLQLQGRVFAVTCSLRGHGSSPWEDLLHAAHWSQMQSCCPGAEVTCATRVHLPQLPHSPAVPWPRSHSPLTSPAYSHRHSPTAQPDT